MVGASDIKPPQPSGESERLVGSKRNLNVFTGNAFNGPKFSSNATFDTSDNVGWNHLDGLVEVRRSSVVELTAVGDLVLQGNELVLEVQEVRVRLEVRVLLRNHVDAWKHTGKHALCSSDTSHVTLSKGTCSRLASDGKLLKNSSFMLGVALSPRAFIAFKSSLLVVLLLPPFLFQFKMACSLSAPFNLARGPS